MPVDFFAFEGVGAGMSNPAVVATMENPAWIKKFPELAAIRDEAGLAALRAASIQTFPAGTRLLSRGDVCQNFLLLLGGTVRIYQTGESGREIALFRLNAGELCVLSLMSTMSAPYSAAAVAEEDIEAAMIPPAYFQDAMARSDAFRALVLTTLAQRLAETMALVEQVAFRKLDLRLACRLGQLFGQQNNRSLHVTHQDLATDIGTTREVISRMLKEFERMGCIRLKRGEIELLSYDTLSRLSCPVPAFL
jgi:CRP/FNR family transcriptional regulator, anaerobic regulatory protein